MPYRRRYGRRRYGYRRRRYGRRRRGRLYNVQKRSGVIPAADWYSRVANSLPALAKTVGIIKTLVNSETHYIDTSFTDPVSSTATIEDLSLVAQGDTEVTRSGNSILFKDILMRFAVTQHVNATTTFIRMVIFIDHQNDGVQITHAELMDITGSTLSHLNKDVGKRVTILKDMYIELDDSRSQSWSSKVYFSLANIRAKYIGTGATAASLGSNSLHIFMMSDQATNTPTVSWESRVKFYDN